MIPDLAHLLFGSSPVATSLAWGSAVVWVWWGLVVATLAIRSIKQKS